MPTTAGFGKGIAKDLLGRRGYHIVQMPKALISHPERVLKPQFAHVVAHQMLHSPDFTFIQIGAFDGRQNDPLYPFLMRFDWHGVLVEPQREAFEALQQTYAGKPHLRFENVAISDHDGIQVMYRLRGLGDVSDWTMQLASLDYDELVRHKRNVPDLEGRIEPEPVDCITFATLWERSGLAGLDLLQVDAEGYDYEIIRSIDFGRVKPSIVRYEHKQLSLQDRDACISLLLEQGYSVAIESSSDTFAYCGVRDVR